MNDDGDFSYGSVYIDKSDMVGTMNPLKSSPRLPTPAARLSAAPPAARLSAAPPAARISVTPSAATKLAARKPSVNILKNTVNVNAEFKEVKIDKKDDEDSMPTSIVTNDGTTDFIYESYDVHFNSSYFFKHLIIQVIGFPTRIFFPTWSNYTVQGYGSVKNMSEFKLFLFNNGLSFAVFATMILYWAAPSNVQPLFGGCAYQTLLFYILHRSNIACKYASLSTKEYDKLMSCSTLSQGTLYNNQIQLVSSYVHRSDELIDFEITAACHRLGFDMHMVRITIADPGGSIEAANNFLAWQAFLLGQTDYKGLDHQSLHPDLAKIARKTHNGYEVSLFQLVRAIVSEADAVEYGYSHLLNFSILASLINWIVPIIWTAASSHSTYDASNTYMRNYVAGFYFISSAPTLIFLFLVFIFGIIALTDAHRRHYEAVRLGSLIRHEELASMDAPKFNHTDSLSYDNSRVDSINRRNTVKALHGTHTKIAKETDKAVPPRISSNKLYSRWNILCWLMSRTIMRTFGARYKFRLDFNLSLVFGTNASFMIIMLVMSIISASSFSSTPEFTISSPVVVQAFLVSGFLLIALGSHIFVSSAVNWEYARQVGFLQSHIFELENNICLLKSQQDAALAAVGPDGPHRESKADLPLEQRVRELEELSNAVKSAKDSVELTDRLNPLRVLGFEASFGLLSAFFSLSISAISTLSGIYFAAGNFPAKSNLTTA